LNRAGCSMNELLEVFVSSVRDSCHPRWHAPAKERFD
jgi:hypothetical protein